MTHAQVLACVNLRQKDLNLSVAPRPLPRHPRRCFVTTLLLQEGYQADFESARAVELSTFASVFLPLS
jgi:hypothetical protein